MSNISKLSLTEIVNGIKKKDFTSEEVTKVFIEKLNELKTEDVVPLTSIAETTLKFRSDEVKSKNIRNQILKNSPEKNEDFFVVPKVVE